MIQIFFLDSLQTLLLIEINLFQPFYGNFLLTNIRLTGQVLFLIINKICNITIDLANSAESIKKSSILSISTIS